MRCVVLLVLVSLAGCSEAPAPEPDPDAVVVEGVPLRGVIVDATVQPLAGVTVLAQPGELTTTTDADGNFLLDVPDLGVYTLTASKDGYHASTTVVTLRGDDAPAKVVLYADPDDVAYASEYVFKGYFECGGGVDDITCSNVNIATWVVLGIGNVTTDRSLFLQWIEGPPTALQTELVWRSTQSLGDRLTFAIGGATEEQLSTGQATTHNYTYGPSALMLTIPQPELAESGIGNDRALLTQVLPAPFQDVPGGCVIYDPCGPGLQLMQPFETFTHAFYGFAPASDWRFSEDGSPVPP